MSKKRKNKFIPKVDYQALLLSAPWQAMRLKIFERDKWTCRACFTTAYKDSFSSEMARDCKTSFHVHHTYYEYGLKPWEYPEESLITLCMDCHGEETREFPKAYQNLMLAFKKAGFTSWDLNELYRGITQLKRNISPGTPHSYGSILDYACKKIDVLREEYLESF